jgi:hypothetical protein
VCWFIISRLSIHQTVTTPFFGKSLRDTENNQTNTQKNILEKHDMLRDSMVPRHVSHLVRCRYPTRARMGSQEVLGCRSDASHIGGSSLTPTTYSYHVWCPCCIEKLNQDMTPLELGSTLIEFTSFVLDTFKQNQVCAITVADKAVE